MRSKRVAIDTRDREPASQERSERSAAQRHALTVLTRLAERRASCSQWLDGALASRLEGLAAIALDVAIETGDPMGTALAESLGRHGSLETLQEIQTACDLDRYLLSVPLREVALTATERSLAFLRENRDPFDEEKQFDFAIAANNRALRLRYLGRGEEGLSTLEEAVAVCRQLAALNPDRFLIVLAQTLNNLNLILGDLGRRGEGLEALEEALRIFKRIPVSKAEDGWQHLAAILANLGVRLRSLGRTEESVSPLRRAVGIYRRVAKAESGPLRTFFAASLHNLGIALAALGRNAAALRAAEEAVEIELTLTEARPDAFQQDLASSLVGLSRRLAALDRREDAKAALREAIDIREILGGTRPAVFLPGFAEALLALGRSLQEDELTEELPALARRGWAAVYPLLESVGRRGDPRIAEALEDLLELGRMAGEIPDWALNFDPASSEIEGEEN